jgi:hypothetical protein
MVTFCSDFSPTCKKNFWQNSCHAIRNWSRLGGEKAQTTYASMNKWIFKKRESEVAQINVERLPPQTQHKQISKDDTNHRGGERSPYTVNHSVQMSPTLSATLVKREVCTIVKIHRNEVTKPCNVRFRPWYIHFGPNPMPTVKRHASGSVSTTTHLLRDTGLRQPEESWIFSSPPKW